MACITNRKCIKCEQVFASHQDFELTCYDCVKKEADRLNREVVDITVGLLEGVLSDLNKTLITLKKLLGNKDSTTIPIMKVEEAIMWLKKDLELLKDN